jgi:hypothetical protein
MDPQREQERLERALKIAQDPREARKVVSPEEVASAEGPPDLRTRAIPVPEEES